MRFVFLSIILVCSVSLTAQSRFTLNGYIRDSATGESVIGATITINGQQKATISNQYGFYSITLDSGVYDISIAHVSYLVQIAQVELNRNTSAVFQLISKAAAMSEVVVYSRRRDANVVGAQMGKIDLSITQIKNIPACMGEVDILKAIQFLPGLRNAGEGNAGFYVRGGGPDQNLIMLDDAVVYNTGHLFGFFSIFNSDAIKNTSLIKGGMPAQYGGRLSSVLDVTMKDGNMNTFGVEGGIGAIASRLSVQGPISKDKASFIVSARRTYIDALVKPFIKPTSAFYGSGYYFYDLNAKINYRFNAKNRLYASGYFGKDVFRFNNASRSFNAYIPWGNSTATVRWNHVFSPKLFANTTVVYNDYNFEFSAAQERFEVTLASGIRDGTLKVDFDYYPIPKHKMKWGGLLTFHRFTPNVFSGRQDSTIFKPVSEGRKNAIEKAIYIQDDWDLSDRWKAAYGVRWSAFSQIGPYTQFTRDADQNKTDSTTYGHLEKIVSYGGLEPRFTLRYSLNSTTSLKGSVTRNLQFIHLVSNSGTTLPTDLWVPSTFRVKPQISWQYAYGLFKNFANNKWETSVEFYYKNMQNQIEYKEGYQPSLKDPEEDFTFGRGWSYGSEWFINKTAGRFTGWFGYTLSWTWRKFPSLNGGEKFPTKYDRRHDLSLVATYELSPRWKLSGVFVYGTGNATSLPERFYIINGVLTQEFSSINQYRLPAYHRLDLSATYTPKAKPGRKLQSSWVFSAYNSYSRMNPYFIYYDQSGSPYNGSLKIEARQVSLFPVLPSVTWNFKL
jgi:hypothetical protein